MLAVQYTSPFSGTSQKHEWESE